MISIKGIDGNVILEVLETKECQHVEELMKSDYIQLSWNSNDNSALPAGAYIEYNDEHYLLLEEYRPTQKDEIEYTYSPQFHSITMYWGKLPFFLYTELTEGKITREPDWQLTDNPANFMACVVEAIQNETGETWKYAVATELKASAFISFDNVDILSGLNAISSEFETEWRADKVNKVLYLGKAIHDTENPITLEVGKNVGVPSVTNNKEGDYTRFYVFGSTRNIEQSYEGSSTQSIVNKRLTLDPAVYSDGYIDIKGHYDENGIFVSELQQGEIFTKTLFFDDVYPRATQGTVESKGLPISDVKARLKWRFDDNGQKVQVGTDESGNAVYDQYAVWYFKIAGLSFNKDMIIAGKKLTCSFESGSLQGYEFELKYHEESETITETPDGVSFIIDAGDYEILFKEENGLIIPSLTGLIPANGNEVALFNIILPEEYIATAYKELETTALTEIKRRKEDLNNYSFSSNPIAFEENNPNLSIGQAVTYINGSYSYLTRVIKLITQIDFPCEQNITIGNEKIQGNITELKEEVVSANTNINVLAILNEQTQSLQESYKRTQEAIIDGFARIKDMWKFDSDGNIYTPYGAYSNKFISARGADETEGGSGGSGSASGINLSAVWESLTNNSDTFKDTLINIAHIPNITVSKITDFSSKVTALIPTNISAFNNDAGYLTSSVIANKADKATTLAGYGITDAYTQSQVDSKLAGYLPLIGGTMANTNLVTNLNADMVDGLHVSNIRKAVFDYVTVTSDFNNSISPNILAPDITEDGDSFKYYVTMFYASQTTTSNRGQMAYGYRTDNIYYRRYMTDSWSDWKQIAFTDSNVASATKLETARTIWGQSFNGTANVTGAMTGVTSLNSLLYLNSTGLGIGVSSPSYKLDVSGDIHSTGSTFLNGATKNTNSGTRSLAVGSGAYALGSYARSLGEGAYAGIRTGNSTYPYASIASYALLPFTVNDETVYGTLIKAQSSLTYSYGGTSYTVQNTTNFTQVLVLITVGSDFVAGVVHPFNNCALTYGKGSSLGRGQKIDTINELSDTVRAITLYTWIAKGTDEDNFANAFTIGSSNKLYAYKGSTSASGVYSVASGCSSVASGYSSVASGYSSVASGAYSVASGAYSVASHESSKVLAYGGISGRASQTVLGYYNAIDSNSALVVGWGSSSARKNVFTVGTDGSVLARGAITTSKLNINASSSTAHITADGATNAYINIPLSGVDKIMMVWNSSTLQVRAGLAMKDLVSLGTSDCKWKEVCTNTLKIGDATLSWDSANGCVKIDKGFASDSFVSAKGTFFETRTVYECVAQFGIYWQDSWITQTINSNNLTCFGTLTNATFPNADIEAYNPPSGSQFIIYCDAFKNAKVNDVEIFFMGFENEQPTKTVVLIPSSISGNALYCRINYDGDTPDMFSGFKIKVNKNVEYKY